MKSFSFQTKVDGESWKQNKQNAASSSKPIPFVSTLNQPLYKMPPPRNPKMDTTTKFLIIIQPDNFPTSKRHTYSYFKIKSSHQKPNMGRCWYHTFTTQTAHEQANCVTKNKATSITPICPTKGKKCTICSTLTIYWVNKMLRYHFRLFVCKQKLFAELLRLFQKLFGKWCARQNSGSMVFPCQRSLNVSNNFVQRLKNINSVGYYGVSLAVAAFEQQSRKRITN